MFRKLKELFITKQKHGKFVCSCCGKEYDEWPALVHNSPVYYSYLSDYDKENIAELTSDICVINHSDQVDRFVRGVLKIPIVGSCRYLEYGIWVSLSKDNFEDYLVNYDNEKREGVYFGWIGNMLGDYENTLNIPSDVVIQSNGFRPHIVPHESYDNPLVEDYYSGISLPEAQKRVDKLLQTSGK